MPPAEGGPGTPVQGGTVRRRRVGSADAGGGGERGGGSTGDPPRVMDVRAAAR